jgi:hypothetical protein
VKGVKLGIRMEKSIPGEENVLFMAGGGGGFLTTGGDAILAGGGMREI